MPVYSSYGTKTVPLGNGPVSLCLLGTSTIYEPNARPPDTTRRNSSHGTCRPHCSEVQTIQALMELALPSFEGLGDGPRQVHRPWMVSTESPASPDSGGLTELLRSSSPCLNLDALSSDDTEGSVGLSNISVTLLCGSDDGHTPVNSDQVLSDEDLLPEAGLDDRRFGIYLRMFRL